jgi:hypothetical protein
VRVAAASIDGSPVDVRSPRRGVAGVVGEVHHRLAQLLVAGHRKLTERCLPEARVTGAAPAMGPPAPPSAAVLDRVEAVGADADPAWFPTCGSPPR